ncbi:unnamed protein product [Effrenium voratum]|uniref:Pentatricopeptide repeat-containing protein, chloroplastic n=1 Tax=Effrenium voratum TaxID=2562239 RepID=A0AA36MUT8_9DINO|nr:unnamed protein product [Effrenium voratum]
MERSSKLRLHKATSKIRDLGRVSAWQSAIRVFEELPTSSLQPNKFSFGATLSACEKSAQWPTALDLLQEMARLAVELDVINCSAALSACEKAKEWRWALQLMSALLDAELRLDVICLGAAVSACATGSAWETALHLADAQAFRLQPNVVTCSAAIRACERKALWQQALLLLARMHTCDIQPNVITLNSAISACEKAGSWEWALALLRSMSSLDLAPDVISYSAASSACEKCAQWQWSLHLLRDMYDVQMQPDRYTYAAAVSACQKAATWRWALQLPREDQVAHGAAISACERGQRRYLRGPWAHALELLEGGPETPDVVSYHAAISACEKAQRWEGALGLLRRTQQLNLDSFLGFSAVLAACASAGQRDRSCGLLRLMRSTQMRPTVSSCQILSQLLEPEELLDLLTEVRFTVLDLRTAARVEQKENQAAKLRQDTEARLKARPGAPKAELMDNGFAEKAECVTPVWDTFEEEANLLGPSAAGKTTLLPQLEEPGAVGTRNLRRSRKEWRWVKRRQLSTFARRLGANFYTVPLGALVIDGSFIRQESQSWQKAPGWELKRIVQVVCPAEAIALARSLKLAGFSDYFEAYFKQPMDKVKSRIVEEAIRKRTNLIIPDSASKFSATQAMIQKLLASGT